MWKLLLLVLGASIVGSLILPAAFWLGDAVLPLMPQPAAPPASLWSEERATLAYCIKEHLPDYDVAMGKEGAFGKPLSIRSKDGLRLVYKLEDGHKGIAFTRRKDTIFITEFSFMSSGCEVVAIDLATGRQLWKSRLKGIGPTGHSEYSNSVNIETDGEKIIVYGNESHGRYVEHLDINSGKMLLNKKFEPLR